MRDSESVRLREKVTRRRTRPIVRCTGALASPRRVARPLAGCGGTTGGDRPDETATLLLDFTPNAVHAGIYVASERGFDTAEGVKLEIRKPSASTDALKLLQGGRADMAILDIHDLGIAREQGRDLVGVMALVQRPLAAVLAQPGVRTPKDLEGKRAGVTGLPSDAAVLRSVVAGAGGDPGPRARDHDRLRGGQGAARRPRGRGDRVLERRGRRAARRSGRACASSASTTTARRPTPSSS